VYFSKFTLFQDFILFYVCSIMLFKHVSGRERPLQLLQEAIVSLEVIKKSKILTFSFY
jgi:hypothetical protein